MKCWFFTVLVLGFGIRICREDWTGNSRTGHLVSTCWIVHCKRFVHTLYTCVVHFLLVWSLKLTPVLSCTGLAISSQNYGSWQIPCSEWPVLGCLPSFFGDPMWCFFPVIQPIADCGEMALVQDYQNSRDSYTVSNRPLRHSICSLAVCVVVDTDTSDPDLRVNF